MQIVELVIVYIQDAEVPNCIPLLGSQNTDRPFSFRQKKTGDFGESGPKGKT